MRLTWPTRGTSGQKTHRPKRTRVAGSTTSAYPAATTMPTAPARPRPAGCRERGEQQGQQREHDGGRADQHGLAGPPQGPAHRGIPVRLRAQLVAVPGDEQQGVVRAGPEDQHREDADRGLVPRRPGRPEHVGGQHGGQPVRDPHDDEGDDPQDRAAVGEDEQERNDRGGSEQQPGVGALEDGTQVGLDRGRARDLHGDAGRGLGAQLAAQGLDGCRDLGVGGAGDRRTPRAAVRSG